MTDQRSDDMLLADTVSDPEAFGEFFDRHYDDILRFFAARVRSPESAADLCAETLAAALQGARGFDPARGGARQWLFGIARHKLSHYWRELRVSREARDRLGITDIPVDDETVRAMARVEIQADRTRVVEALDGLPRDQAQAVRLRVVEELDYAVIAESLCCNEGAARVKVHRGLRRLELVLGSADTHG